MKNKYTKRSAVASKTMVVAPTPEAVQAGVSILRQGGNAVDAAAATAFALTVTDPAMCSLGGRSQILIYLKDGQFCGIDGATQSPRLVFEPAKTSHGYRTCAILGSPAALEEMVIRFGSLPLRMIMKPAIELAQDGFVIKKDYHDLFAEYKKIFRRYPGTARHFLKEDGSCYVEGETFRQPALARTLEIMANDGAGAFYKGKLANAIVVDMLNNNGLIRKDDLAQYHTIPGEIVEGHYRSHRIVSRGDQCDGASVIEILHILEHFPLSEYKLTDPKYLHILAQSMFIGFSDEYLPDWQQVSKELAARRVREIDLEKAFPVPIEPKKTAKDGETNHLSVIDEEGNAVALTQSVGPPFGSKVANPELGFLYAFSYNMVDHPLQYHREKSSQSPTIVFQEDHPYIVIGSAGNVRIPASIVQTIVNVIDHNMSVDKAVSAPRLFLTDQELHLEAMELPESTITELNMLGYNIKTYDQLHGFLGRVHAILIDRTARTIHGAADPRDYGAAGGY
jgi:gamma-glutamyltranspeptidase/glutathione hydrolase